MLRSESNMEGRKTKEDAMRSSLVLVLALAGSVVASQGAFAKHEDDHSFPWAQTQSVRSHKTEKREAEHWGKHHHHGIYLEGSDYEHPSVRQYD